jgi:DNA-damage-inducible protein J
MDMLVVKGVFCMSTVNVTIRMDEELKKQAEELFFDLGLSMTAALIVFTKQAVREQRIPFNVSRNIPNEKTIAAIEEVERMKLNPKAYKGYDNVDDMMKELLK